MPECLCGSVVKNIKVHLKTQKHLRFLEENTNGIMSEIVSNRLDIEEKLVEARTVEEKTKYIQMILDLDCYEQNVIEETTED